MEQLIFILFGILFISLVTTSCVDALKKASPIKLKSPFPQLLSLGISIMLCVSANLDIFVAFGYVLSCNMIGLVITGIIASLGAGGVFDLYTKINEYKGKVAIEKYTEDK